MSGQTPQRVRGIPSPSTKQGPMKATKSFGLGSSSSRAGVKKTSPSSSPTQQTGGDYHRKRRSPDHRQSPDRTVSPALKEKSRSCMSPCIKRTGSYDTIIAPYLKGEWPREPYMTTPTYFSQPALTNVSTAEKQTQTPKEWVDELFHSIPAHKRSQSVGNGDVSKEEMKGKYKKGSKSNRDASGSSPVQGKHSLAAGPLGKSIPIGKHRQFRSLYGSTEGINQEIEKFICLKISSGSEEPQETTPDGHRAPVQELLDKHKTRSAITQTPSRKHQETNTRSHDSLTPSSQAVGLSPIECCTSPLSLTSSPRSSPLSTPSSRASSAAKDEDKLPPIESCDFPDPKECMFIREPPDGAEKVSLKVTEEERQTLLRDLMFPDVPVVKPLVEKFPIPSNKSAFNPLLKNYHPSAVTYTAFRQQPSILNNNPSQQASASFSSVLMSNTSAFAPPTTIGANSAVIIDNNNKEIV